MPCYPYLRFGGANGRFFGALVHRSTDRVFPGALEQSLAKAVDESASGLAALAAVESSPSERASAAEEQLRLADALLGLPADQAEVVVLKYLQGWTLRQVAEQRGRTVPAVASLLRRGLARLRAALEEGET